jgi:hypothetical protein
MHDKKTEIVTVRLSPKDLSHLMKAAALLWPGAPITKSSILLGLACLKADELLKRKPSIKKAVHGATLLLFGLFAWA